MIGQQVASFSAANWAGEVENASVPVLVDVGANWCAPCRMIAPVIAELAGEYSGSMKFGTLDVDAETAVAAQYGVVSLPTLLIFKDGQPIDRIVGFTPKQELKRRLNKLLG